MRMEKFVYQYWEHGMGWKSVMNIEVFYYQYNLYCEFPIVNEPGYEECKPDSDRSSITIIT